VAMAAPDRISVDAPCLDAPAPAAFDRVVEREDERPLRGKGLNGLLEEDSRPLALDQQQATCFGSSSSFYSAWTSRLALRFCPVGSFPPGASSGNGVPPNWNRHLERLV
jgi:hypothetical protein